MPKIKFLAFGLIVAFQGQIFAKSVKLSPICCACAHLDCTPAKRNCSLVLQGMSLASNDQISLSGKIRRSVKDDNCGGFDGGYILEPQALINTEELNSEEQGF